jgi:hypothetical protein
METHVSRRGPLCRTQYFEWWLSQCFSSRAVANVLLEIECPEGVTSQAVDIAARLVLSRHEAFRTTFGLDAAGMPEQLIHPVGDLPPIAHVVLDSPDGDAQAILELASHEFNISAEMPVKATIISRQAGQGDSLLICCPHVVCDYHSMEIIRAEILALLENPGSEENSALPNRGPQPLDIAFGEALSYSTRSEAIAARYWVKALSAAPLRNFWRSYDIDTEMYQARATSHDAPVLLSRYALAHGSTPSIIYTALIHIIISLISNRASTLVRFFFTGRPHHFENSVGPFHRELFSTVEISDSDTLSACLRKATTVIMQARARYSLDYLSFREAEIKEETRRGSAFAWGTIVNVADTPEFRSRWRELPDAPASTHGEPLYSVTPVGSGANERGMEVFLRAVIEPTFMSVIAEFNSTAVRPENAEILVRGPWDIIRNSLATGEDTEIAGLRRRYGFAPPARPEEEGTAHALRLRDTEAVLERFPGVTASFLAVRSDRSPAEVVAYAAVDRHEITTTDLRDHVLSTLKPSAAVICPDYFIICDAVPGDRTSETSWRTVKRLAQGTGISPRRFLCHTVQEAALLQAIREVSHGESADLAKSYVESGGTLLKVPAILRLLARAGFTGLRAKDFESHAQLYQLARRLSSDPPAE